MSPSDLALAAAGLILAGLVKGVTGIGYATCAMPILAMAVGLHAAMAIVVVPAIVSNAALLATGGGLVRTATRFRLFYLASVPGIACGILLLGAVDPRIATQGLGLLTIAYVVQAVVRPDLILPARFEKPLALPAGFLNGVLTGLTGSQIFPLVPYMLALKLDAGTQVQAINLAVTIAALALGASLVGAGIMTPELLVLSCAGAGFAIAGVLAGTALRSHLPVDGLRRATLVVLLAIAVGLVGQDAFDGALVLICGPSQARAEPASAAPCLRSTRGPSQVFPNGFSLAPHAP